MVCHVTDHPESLGAGRSEFGDRLVEGGFLDVGDHHPHAGLGETVGEGPSHSRRAAGDNRYPSGQIVHYGFPTFRVWSIGRLS